MESWLSAFLRPTKVTCYYNSAGAAFTLTAQGLPEPLPDNGTAQMLEISGLQPNRTYEVPSTSVCHFGHRGSEFSGHVQSFRAWVS